MSRKKASRILYIAWLISCISLVCFWKFVMGYGIFEIHFEPYACLSALNGVLMGLYVGINIRHYVKD